MIAHLPLSVATEIILERNKDVSQLTIGFVKLENQCLAESSRADLPRFSECHDTGL